MLDKPWRPKTCINHADRLFLHPARGQAAGLGQGVPLAARSPAGGRGRPPLRRRLEPGRLLLPRAHRAGEGREALRQVRPRLRRLLQGRGAGDRLHQGSPGRLAAQDAGARADARAEGRHREDGLGRADGDAQEAPGGAEGPPRRRQQVDRHRRHQPLRPRRLQPAGRAHRRRQQEPQRRQGVGAARLPRLRRHPGAGHTQHQGGAAPPAQVRARGQRAGTGPAGHHPQHGGQRGVPRHQDGARAPTT